MYAVNRNDHSGQSLCSPVNVGTLPIVRVSTSAAVTFGTAATCCRVSIKARSVCTRRVTNASVSALISASAIVYIEKCCFIIGCTPRVPLPRLRIFFSCPVSLDNYCSSTPPYTPYHRCPPLSTSPTTRSHVEVVYCKCISHVLPFPYSPSLTVNPPTTSEYIKTTPSLPASSLPPFLPPSSLPPSLPLSLPPSLPPSLRDGDLSTETVVFLKKHSSDL